MKFAKLVLTLSLLVGTGPALAAPVCSDAFVEKSKLRVAFSSMAQNTGLASVAAELKDILVQVRASRFKIENYDQAVELYRSTETASWEKPANREAKLAILQVFTERSGTNALAIESVVKSYANNPPALRKLTNSIGKIDPTKGFSGVQLDNIWLKVYGYQFVPALASPELKEKGASAIERELLRQWTDRVLAKHSLPEAAQILGLYRDASGAKERFAEWYQKRSKGTDFVAKGIVNVMSFYTRGFIQSRAYSALDHQKISDEVRVVLERDGFDATYPLLKKYYGSLASFDRRFYLTKKYFLRTATAAMLIYFYPVTVEAVIGANRYDADGKSYGQLTEDLAVHTARAARNFYYVKIKGDDGVVRTVKVKSVLDPKDSLQLNDGAGRSTDPDPVPVSKYNGEQAKKAQQAKTQKVLEQTEAFNRQFGDADKILDTGVGQEDTSQEEVDQYNRDLDSVKFDEFEPRD